MSTVEQTATIRYLVPLLVVDDIEKSVKFYVDRLGFTLGDTWRPDGKLAWCQVQRGGAALMFQQACPGEDAATAARGRGDVGVWFYFHCVDADAAHAEFAARGVQMETPCVAFYGMKQIFVRDPDGYTLCFQSPSDEPPTETHD